MATMMKDHVREYALFAARRFIPVDSISLERALEAGNTRIADPSKRYAAIEFYRIAAANALAVADTLEGGERDRHLDVAARAALRVLYKDKGVTPILLE